MSGVSLFEERIPSFDTPSPYQIFHKNRDAESATWRNARGTGDRHSMSTKHVYWIDASSESNRPRIRSERQIRSHDSEVMLLTVRFSSSYGFSAISETFCEKRPIFRSTLAPRRRTFWLGSIAKQLSAAIRTGRYVLPTRLRSRELLPGGNA